MWRHGVATLTTLPRMTSVVGDRRPPSIARLSSCPRITSPIPAMAMRIDRVVQLRLHWASLQPHPGFFLSGGAPLRRVVLPVQARTAMEARFRPGRADVLQDRLVTDQRLAAPVGADRTKHPVLDRVPLTRSSRVVRHGQGQPELIGQPLQRHLPPPFPVVVGPTAVHLDQQPFRLRIAVTADIQPPATNRGHGEVRRVVRGTDDDVAIVVRQVVDAGGDRSARRPTGIVVIQDVAVAPPPATARILEVADPLLLLGIDANDWQAMSYVPVPEPRQVAELLIPVGIPNPRQPLAVGPQGGLPLPQQPGDRTRRQVVSAAAQGLLDIPQRAMRPLQPGDRVSGGRIAEQFLQETLSGIRVFAGFSRSFWAGILIPD